MLPAHDPTPGLSSVSLLLVDDDRFLLRLLSEVLISAGAKHITKAHDGATALALLTRKPPDLVFLDIGLPDMSGLDVLRFIRTSRQSPDRYLPVIVFTAHTEMKTIMEARDCGATEVISKPIIPVALLTRLAHVINSPRDFVLSEGYIGPSRRRHRGVEAPRGDRRRDDREIDL